MFVLITAILIENHKILMAGLDGMRILLSKEHEDQQFWQFHFLVDDRKDKKTQREISVTHTATLDFVVSLTQRGS